MKFINPKGLETCSVIVGLGHSYLLKVETFVRYLVNPSHAFVCSGDLEQLITLLKAVLFP